MDPVRRRCRACYRMGQTYADRQNVKRVSTVTFLISIISRGNIGGRRRGQREGGGGGKGEGRNPMKTFKVYSVKSGKNWRM